MKTVWQKITLCKLITEIRRNEGCCWYCRFLQSDVQHKNWHSRQKSGWSDNGDPLQQNLEHFPPVLDSIRLNLLYFILVFFCFLLCAGKEFHVFHHLPGFIYVDKFSFPSPRRRKMNRTVKWSRNDETEKLCTENYNQPFVTYLINDNKRDKWYPRNHNSCLISI